MDDFKESISNEASQQIVGYIVNRPKKLQNNRLTAEIIQAKSMQSSSIFPSQCAQKVLELYNIEPTPIKISTMREESLLLPSQSFRDIRRSAKITHSIARHSTRTSRKNSISLKRSVIVNQQNLAGEKYQRCIPLPKSQAQDKFIQTLRQKKQRVFELQQYFNLSEKLQKSQFRQRVTETIKNVNFTTDFEGNKLEMKTLHRKKDPDPYFRVEMPLTIQEEKQNKLILSNTKINDIAQYSSKKGSSQSTRKEFSNKSKPSKESGDLEAFTLREIESFLIRQGKRRKQLNLNRRSKLRLLETMSLNVTKLY